MYEYNRTIQKVIKSASQWEALLSSLVKEQSEGLKEHNCLPIHDEEVKEVGYPPSYPVLVRIFFHGSSIGTQYITQTEVMDLLGLTGLQFHKHAGVMRGSVSSCDVPPEDINVCDGVQRLFVPAEVPIIPVVDEPVAVTAGVYEGMEDRVL